ncbi:hypothetical protein STRTUCAR8_00180 [Streptomyces turgidiscabies Car8]|uniref:Integrase catalytic domain-containing protein n=1 Tax=Streptomyces turgidiscabies (strain Car8) TaxID=698760 RepID=L7F5H7_STRT8|nr:hypothetical protein STRTUCAR8_00180 [Streptomyces turgidiscabies Car8]
MGGRPDRRKGRRSEIGTLVDRSTRYDKILHLLCGRGPEQVRDALVHALGDLPAELARSVTWDQGSEMSRHDEFTRATGIPVYFCEPASPWQRGSHENTNGLLRQYFPQEHRSVRVRRRGPRLRRRRTRQPPPQDPRREHPREPRR